MNKLIIVISIVITCYLIHRFCLWLESRGLLYYLNKKSPNSALGTAMEELSGIINPSARYTIEMKQNEAIVRSCDAENPDEPMTNDQGKRYDLIASGFSNLRDSFNTEKKYLDLLMHHLNKGDHILDIGCGSGFPIATYFIENGFNVTGVDSSNELLKIAQVKCPKMQRIFGDVRSIDITNKFDAIVEWWCLFHLPKNDHEKMIVRFASWLKPGGILEFTTGDNEYEATDQNMLNQELSFYSLDPKIYEACLIQNGFEIILCENDQEGHKVWVAKYKEIK